MSKVRRCRYCSKVLPEGYRFFCPDRDYPKPSSCTRKFEEEYGDFLDEVGHLKEIKRLYKSI